MQIALITGANSGIGLATATALAKQSFQLVILVRNQQKAAATREAVVQEVPDAVLDFYLADLSDLVSVKTAADAIVKKYTHIDRLINNAGYAPAGIEFTADGLEKSFVANHLGHFVLTMNLLGMLKQSPESRVINVSSSAHALGSADRLFRKNNSSLSDLNAYADGKLANILFTKGLVNHTQGSPITVYALHPGVVQSNFASNTSGIFKWMMRLARPFMISVERGAATSIYLATTSIKNIAGNNGGYFKKSRPAKTANKDINPKNIAQCWEQSMAAATDFL